MDNIRFALFNCDMICHSACTDHIGTIFYLNTCCCCWLNILQKNHWLFIYFLFFFLSFGGVCLAVLSANVKVVGLHLLKLKLQGSRVHSVVRVRLYLNPLAPSWTGAPTHQAFNFIESVHCPSQIWPDTSQTLFQASGRMWQDQAAQ